MDAATFKAGFDLLKLLPVQGGPDPQRATERYEGYRQLFRSDDAELFLAACEMGVQTAWEWFPSPKQIRELMVAIEDARLSKQRRALYAHLVDRSLEHESASSERRECRNDDCDLCARAALVQAPRALRALPPPRPALGAPSPGLIAEAHAMVKRAREVVGDDDRPRRRAQPQHIGGIIDLAARRRQPTSDGGMP